MENNNNNNNNNIVNNKENGYIGLMAIGEYLNEKAIALEEDYFHVKEDEIIETYKQAIIIHGCYSQGLAIYYEKQYYSINIIEYYFYSLSIMKIVVVYTLILQIFTKKMECII